MTTGENDETGGVGCVILGEGETGDGNQKPSPSFTTLSTIAIQAGQSQIVVSVLQSGSLLHLQLVQVHPGLCEIGLSKDENQMLIQEQQQLIEKLKKHEREVLAVVENRQESERRKKKNKEIKKGEDVDEAMVASLSEGWSLLLHLLERRQEVLMLASDFFQKAQEFGVSINRAENLQIKPDDEKQVTYNSMSRDLLGKSLHVLTSSSVLLQKLRQLQRTEVLLKRGRALQQEEESSHCSRGMVLKLEEMVEMLQDRRRKVDRTIRLQLQQVKDNIMNCKKEEESRQKCGPDEILDQIQQCESTSAPKTAENLQSDSRTEETTVWQFGSRSENTGLLDSASRSDSKGSSSKETRDLQSGLRSVLKPGFVLKEKINLQPGSKSEDNRDLQSGSKFDLKPGSRSEAGEVGLSELSRDQDETKDVPSRQQVGPQSMLGNKTENREDHAHQTFLTNRRQQLLLSCEQLLDKVWSWVQQGSSVLSNCSEARLQLCEAEDSLNTHLQLHTQAESAGLDAENLRRVLDQITALHTDSTSRDSGHPPSEPSRQLSPLKALTEQLKKGSIGKQTRTSTTSSSLEADSSFTFSPELTGRVDLVLKELQSLNRKLNSNLQLLQLYVTFLRAAQQVEEEVEELKEMCRRRPEEEQESPSSCSHVRSPQKKKQVDACWQETLQRCHTAQEMGHDCVHTVTTVSGSGLNLQALLWAVQQMLERLSKTEQEVNELQTQQLQEDMRFYRKYHDRLLKSQQDLKSVSELLDSCTSMDLGLDLQTSRLQEHFIQARPHLIKLDAEVEYTVRSWESLRGVQERLEVKEEEVLSCVELLKLQKRVKDKIQQSESILNRTSSFHLTAKKLEALLQSDPASNSTGSTGLCGSTEAELRRHRDDRQQIQSLFETASTLKTEICTAVKHSGCTSFRVQQLETRLLDLDSLCSSWLREAARREEKLHRQLLTDALNDDISQLRDSFKELKKRFSNTKFNYLKRNDRTRNMKAIRNQLQQVETYKEKLQVLRKRLQAVMSRLGSDVKDRSAARQTEDAVNELQRQMGEFERSVSEYQKTLDMTCRLQKAMEEYQFWCEEASATIARVGKFSLECRSTEAVSVLSRQFEKFVWPTVPQQEERISQMTELAVTLHGEEDGRRYVEKTVSKHSQMVESIRKLSDGLMELEAKLKMESLKQQQHEIKEENPMEQRTEEETQEKDEDKEKKTKGNRKMKKKEQMDNRSTQESADVYELKETGHTPELTSEQEGREVLMKTQTAANKKPQLRKSPSQEPDSERSERLTSSYFSTHTFSLSCTPVEAHRQAHAIQATLPYSRTGSSLTDIHRKERQETGQQNVSAGGLMELELQQQEAMTEDSLSTDDYECVSPDDISLPPLAETPESIMVQSDIEDGFCFSCHSVHISQYSHHYPTQPEHHGSSTATAQQQTDSSQTDGGLTPPTSLHSSTRFRSESSSFVQCPLTGSAPVPNMFTSTLCGNLRTEETITSDFPQSDDLPMGNAEMSFTSGSNLVHRSNTTDRLNNVPVKRSSLQSEHNSQNKQPRRNSHGENTQNVTYIHGILPKTDPLLQAADLIPSPTLPQILSPNLDLNKGKTYSQHTGFLLNTRTDNYQDSLTECFSDTGSGLNQAINSQIIKETFSGYSSSSPQASFLPQSETSPQIDTAASLKDTSSSFTATTTGTQQGVYSLSSSSEGHCTLEQPGSKENLFSTGAGDLPDVHVPILLEPNDISNIKISSSTTINSNRFINNQSYQTVYSLHESLTSTSTQQCVHDSGSRPAAPSQPEAQMQALAQQANLHAHPHHHPSSPPHILTPDRDPDICQPMAIREEIRLTPQIQGPPLPTPPSPLPRAQTESLPQGKASTYVPTCFTRPLSRATVMEGSPVTLEVEVTGESKPTLTWFKDGEVSATSLGRVLACEDEKHFLFIPEASDSDGGLYKVRAANYQNSQLVASSSSDKWSMAEVLDSISVDWQTWFGTLCVLLWLLYLIVL